MQHNNTLKYLMLLNKLHRKINLAIYIKDLIHHCKVSD